ncbi:MAG: hypothetical protein IPH93_10235 [Saprospiraceae bacterium]|nr:hypothetical protein [Saprospiraceae bacterium]MBK7812426.1 hypothetical protein [Saprospiraceae bacterium]MBK9632349.1 hypothetical protein [Saprospiraceae bacterium]
MTSVPDINYLLWWHANAYGWLDIPGLAYFLAIKNEAHIDHQNQLIYPPTLKLQLTNDAPNRADEMLQNIIVETGFSKQDLESQLEDLCAHLRSNMIQSGSVEFEPYGILKLLEDQSKSFTPSDFNAHHGFVGNQAIPISALKMNYQRNDELIAPIIPIKKKKEPNLKWLYYLLAFLWILFLVLLFWPSGKKQKSNAKNSNITELKDTLTYIEPTDTSSMLVVSDTMSTSDTTQAIILPKEEEIKEDNITELNKIVQGKTCVIIVGSFIKKNNAIRLEKKVVHDGYTSFTEEFGKFNRVGIQFDCMQRNLEEVLAELKQKYHPDSWILKH